MVKKFGIYDSITNIMRKFESEWIKCMINGIRQIGKGDSVINHKTSNGIQNDDDNLSNVKTKQEISKLSQMCLHLSNECVDISLRQTRLTLSKPKMTHRNSKIKNVWIDKSTIVLTVIITEITMTTMTATTVMIDMTMVKHSNEESMVSHNDHDIAIASENKQNETNHMTKPDQENEKDCWKLNNFDVKQYGGIIAVLIVHENENYTSWFKNVTVSQSNSIDASLFH